MPANDPRTEKERINRFAALPFLDGPAETIVKATVEELLKVKAFQLIFADNIDSYKRLDYSLRSLPGIRVYSDGFTKTAESWFIDGDLTADVIYPPSLRREETQRLQDVVASALVQQFRRQSFFTAVELKAPGLNQLGKTVTVDKSLGLQLADEIAPLTQLRINFRVDLRQWDNYLEQDRRTKGDPFERTLEHLEKLAVDIQGLQNETDTEPAIEIGAEVNT